MNYYITAEVRLYVNNAKSEEEARLAAQMSLVQAPIGVLRETEINVSGVDVVCCTEEE